jgi:SAM-dependent methyltransferase
MRRCWCDRPAQRIVRRFSSDAFEVARCKHCGTYSIDRLSPSPEHERYRVSLEARELVNLPNARGILERCEPYVGPGPRRLLDVGAGDGALLEVAVERGFEVMGVELEAELAAEARRHGDFVVLGVPIEQADLPADHFALITMSHVVEHVDDPPLVLAALAGTLQPGGVIYVETPNAASGAGRFLYGRRWQGIWAPGHLWIFSRRSLEHLTRPLGLEIAGCERWSAPLYKTGLRKWVKFALYALLDRVTEPEAVAVFLRRPQ